MPLHENLKLHLHFLIHLHSIFLHAQQSHTPLRLEQIYILEHKEIILSFSVSTLNNPGVLLAYAFKVNLFSST